MQFTHRCLDNMKWEISRLVNNQPNKPKSKNEEWEKKMQKIKTKTTIKWVKLLTVAIRNNGCKRCQLLLLRELIAVYTIQHTFSFEVGARTRSHIQNISTSKRKKNNIMRFLCQFCLFSFLSSIIILISLRHCILLFLSMFFFLL